MPRGDRNPAGSGGEARRGLLDAFRESREALLQACWAHRLWSGDALHTADGSPLEVLFPGWLNAAGGPDFTEARVRIGGQEWFGDVEVHLSERGWAQHGHVGDAAYRRVILHVVLERGGSAPALGLGEKPVPVFHAAPFLPQRVELVMGDAESMLARYASLPGRCGLRALFAGEDAVSGVIAHAAETRARQKADRLAPLFEHRDEAQILFELVFQSLGYRPYAATFLTLARQFPLRSLEALLDLPLADARDAVLARWFGAAGLLDGEPAGDARDPGAAEEHDRWKDLWRGLALAPPADPFRRRPSRPWNAPERRLVGMFHHLHGMGRGGWLKRWLALLVELDSLRNAKHLRREAVRALERLFDAPDNEPWRRRITFASPPPPGEARLVGADRAIVVMANAVIPFFLAYARRRGDRELEKLLYRLFIVLPPEAPNAKTRFMEARLMLSGKLPRTLRSQQGLLQIHRDFCTRFDAGCDRCRLPDLIQLP